MESKGQFCYPELISTVLLRQLEHHCCSCWNHHCHCFAGSQAPALLPPWQEPISPQFHRCRVLARAVRALLLFCNCSTIAAISSPKSQIPRALSCRGCWSTIAEIASSKSRRRKKKFLWSFASASHSGKAMWEMWFSGCTTEEYGTGGNGVENQQIDKWSS